MAFYGDDHENNTDYSNGHYPQEEGRAEETDASYQAHVTSQKRRSRIVSILVAIGLFAIGAVALYFLLPIS